MAGHTPGPWSFDAGYIVAVVDGKEKLVADLDVGGQISEADAQLITAAPELLQAVLAGGRYCDALRPHQDAGARGTIIQDTGELERLFVDWYDKLCAANAKAEGRS